LIIFLFFIQNVTLPWVFFGHFIFALITLAIWNVENKMVLNEKKNKAMIVASSSKMSKLPDHLIMTINQSQIETVPLEKLLGVYID